MSDAHGHGVGGEAEPPAVELLGAGQDDGAAMETVVAELKEMYGLNRAGAEQLGMLERIERLLELDERQGSWPDHG